MNAMGCKETNRVSSPESTIHHRIDLVGGFAIQDGNKTTVPDIQWFDRPSDAWSLRQQLLRYYNLTAAPRPRPLSKSEPLRIGFVQRSPAAKRVILNMPEIVTALQKEFPTAVITNTTLSGMNVGEQALYFASQDIIIAGHGAALTNCAFLQQGSLVIQTYPKHYYPTFFFEPMIRQVKSHAYAWYAGYPEKPLEDYLNNFEHRFKNRPVDMRPPVHEIVAMVVNATTEVGLIRK
jgi:hypothetical protein